MWFIFENRIRVKISVKWASFFSVSDTSLEVHKYQQLDSIVIRKVEISKQIKKVKTTKEIKTEYVLLTSENENVTVANSDVNDNQANDGNKLEVVTHGRNDLPVMNESQQSSEEEEGWMKLIAEKDRSIASLAENIAQLQKTETDLKASLAEKDREVQKYRNMYEGDASADCLPFSQAERQSFENLVKYIHGIDSNPQGIRAKERVIKKFMEKILAYKKNSDNLITKCKYD